MFKKWTVDIGFEKVIVSSFSPEVVTVERYNETL